MLKEIKQLYDLGFGILWIKPNDKRPITSGWTKGPRQTWDELKRTYKPGMNVGVALGHKSFLKKQKKYLAVLDCDIKANAEQGKAQSEMFSTLALFPEEISNAKGPVCFSGRQNGSMHIYVLTDKPLKSGRITSGDGWEIDLMSEGRQVVLPPSIHPVSGKAYTWKNTHWDLTPSFSGEVAIEKESSSEKEKFTPIDVDIDAIGLSRESLSALKEGDEVEDRSSAVFSIMGEMVKLGLSDTAILSVFTNREFYLGEVAYDHRKTSDISNAANWLKDFCLKKARQEFDPINDFEIIDDDGENLSRSEALKKLGDGSTWKNRLELTAKTDTPKNTFSNVRLILEHALGQPAFKYNAFSNRELHTLDAPWAARLDEGVTDNTISQIRDWLSRNYRFEPARTLVNEVVSFVARSHAFHPVRDYLESLKWDGKPRIDTWLTDYLGAKDEPEYIKIIGSKTLMGMVARILEPGIKFDHVLILEGNQGIGKSTVAEILASSEWFTDNLPDIRDKDSRLNLLGNWVIELSELVSMKRSDAESVKSFMSARIDRVRAPYGERWEEFKRQSIFIGTTNATQYLKDSSGNRRFWPIEVHEVNYTQLRKDRDQLFAEALFRYQVEGDRIWLLKKEQIICEKAQHLRRAHSIEDDMVEVLEKLLKKKEGEEGYFNFERFSPSDLFGVGGPLEQWSNNPYKYNLSAIALKRLGFSSTVSKGRKHYRISPYLPPQ